MVDSSIVIKWSVPEIHPMRPLFGAALRIALETGSSAYDSMYLALTETLSTQMVTADCTTPCRVVPTPGLCSGSRMGLEQRSVQLIRGRARLT